MDRSTVEDWVARYERTWRSSGTAALADLFAADASYLMSPWAEPVLGIEKLARFWEAERDGPDEQFDMSHEVVAVEGDTAVVRVAVDYATGSRWRDLWVMRFDDGGHCIAFEEWPSAPTQPDGH